jgi:hypothetical protein
MSYRSTLKITNSDPLIRKRVAEVTANGRLLSFYKTPPIMWEWVASKYGKGTKKTRDVINNHMPCCPTRKSWCLKYWGSATEATLIPDTLKFVGDTVEFQVESSGPIAIWVDYMTEKKGFDIEFSSVET